VATLKARVTQEQRHIEQLQERRRVLLEGVGELEARKADIEKDLTSVAAKLEQNFGSGVKEIQARLQGVSKKLEESRATRFAIEDKRQAFTEATNAMTKEVANFAGDNKKKKEKKYDKLVEKVEASLVSCTKSAQATEAVRKKCSILEDEVRHEVDCLRLLVDFTAKSK
jgi:DNA topoisomerase VI subunit B